MKKTLNIHYRWSDLFGKKTAILRHFFSDEMVAFKWEVKAVISLLIYMHLTDLFSMSPTHLSCGEAYPWVISIGMHAVCAPLQYRQAETCWNSEHSRTITMICIISTRGKTLTNACPCYPSTIVDEKECLITSHRKRGTGEEGVHALLTHRVPEVYKHISWVH